jgi:hypothetical protein
MKPAKLETSSVYSLFDAHEHQQPMSEKHVRHLKESMREYGYFPSQSVQVYRKGRRFVIIDGHHRFTAAKELGIPFTYVVEPESHGDLIGLVNEKKNWKPESYVSLYAGQDNVHYQTLLVYVGKGIPLHAAASLLYGHSAGSGSLSGVIRDGSFKVKTQDAANQIVSIFERVGEQVPVVKSRVYIEAISLLLYVEEFDPSTFCDRTLANCRMFAKCSTRDQALDLIEEVYNFRSRVKPLIAGLARQKARERSLGAR